MYNWSTDTSTMSPEEKEIFGLEQRINYGLNGEKLDIASLLRHFNTLSIDPARRIFLKKLLDASNS